MAYESVVAPGHSVDVTCSEIILGAEGVGTQQLPAAVEEWDWARKTEEEITYLQGNVLPAERTQGQESFEVNMTWGGRQWERFKALMGGWDNGIRGREFNMTITARPKNDNQYYTFNITRLRFLDEGGKFGKEAFKQPLRCSAMNVTSTPKDNAT